MTRRVKPPDDEPVVTNAALELFRISARNGRYAFTYVDSIGVIERHRFVEVAQEAAQWAHLLRQCGLERGERIIVLAGRDRHWRSALLGVVEAGGVAVPCPASMPLAQIRSLAAASRAVCAVSAFPRPDLAATAGTGVLCARDLSRQTYAHADVAYPTKPEDFAVIVNRHDGSGFRGAAYTHDALLEQASSGERRLGMREGERVWCTVSEGSAASLWLALAAWHQGVELVVVEDELAPQKKLELLDILKPAAVWFSDEEYAALAAADAPAWVDLSSIGQAMTSGEPDEGAVAFQDAFGVTAVRAPVSTVVVGVAAGPEPAEPTAPTGQRLARAEASRRAEQAAARADARSAEEVRRREEERLHQEKEARRRAEQEARERRNEDKRRGEEEAKQSKLAEKAAREAAQAEERRRAKEATKRELAARAAAEQRERAEKAASEAMVAEERRRGVRLEDVRAGGGEESGERIRSEAGLGAPAALGDECTIVWWRGYVKSGFFAFAMGGRARTAELESSLGSSLFRKIGGGPPVPVPEGRALEAHGALVERMQSEGWEPVGCGTHWYETRLRLTRAPEAVKDAAIDSSPGRPLAVPAPLPRATANHAEEEQRREEIRRHDEKKVYAARKHSQKADAATEPKKVRTIVPIARSGVPGRKGR